MSMSLIAPRFAPAPSSADVAGAATASVSRTSVASATAPPCSDSSTGPLSRLSVPQSSLSLTAPEASRHGRQRRAHVVRLEGDLGAGEPQCGEAGCRVRMIAYTIACLLRGGAVIAKAVGF